MGSLLYSNITNRFKNNYRYLVNNQFIYFMGRYLNTVKSLKKCLVSTVDNLGNTIAKLSLP